MDCEAAKSTRVVAVVVTYNRKTLLRECLSALLSIEDEELKILVVDNASTDGTAECVAEFSHKRLEYVNTGSNLGGAGGFYVGVKHATREGCDYIWLMDDDCIASPEAYFALRKFAKGKRFGFLSSVAKTTDGDICEMNVQRISVFRSVKDFERGATKIKFASFVSLFLSREAVERCGLPIKEFFIWGDDWEYTSRISKSFDCFLVGESVVTHKAQNGGRSDVATDGADRLGRYFYAYRNEKYLFSKLGIAGRLYFFLKVLYHTARILLSGAEDKGVRYKVLRSGVKAGKRFYPRAEYIKEGVL